MKTRLLVCSMLAAGFLTACQTEKENQSELQAQAKISKADAQATALAKVPGGTLKDSELEREKGKLIWSFEFSTPGSKDITEVNVDATTGAVVGVEHEKEK